MPRALFLLAVFLLSLGLPAPRSVRAEDGEAKLGTPITGLPFTIGSPGVYVLRADLSTTAAGGLAIAVQADNVTIDLNGHTLSNSNASNTAAGVGGSDRRNVTVRNGGLRGFFGGVDLVSSAGDGSLSSGHLLENLRVSDSPWLGLRVFGNANVVRGCQVTRSGGSAQAPDGQGYGIVVQAGAGARVLDNDVAGVSKADATHSAFGIFAVATTDALVVGNRISGPADYGLYYYAGTTGKYRGNLVGAGVTRGYFGPGTDAGRNAVDSDGDGIDDDWERRYFGNLSTANATSDSDGDGVSDLAEYRANTSPTDYYNGVAPTVAVASGNNQYGYPGQVLAQALVVQVNKGGGGTQPAANAPVLFQPPAGFGLVAANPAGPWTPSVTVRADAAGRASAFLQLPAASAVGALTTVQATAGLAAPLTLRATFRNGPRSVVAGQYHTLALDGEGAVWSWGFNTAGELGNNTNIGRPFPGRVPALSGGVVAAGAGMYYSVALKADGTVWSWGGNSYGQLGDGSTNSRPVPAQVSNADGNDVLHDITAIAVGASHCLALDKTGRVYAWGSNTDGKLGIGGNNGGQQTRPVLVSGDTGLYVGSPVVAICAGYGHSLALRADGTVWAWGGNASGALGVPGGYPTATPKQVAGANGVGFLTGVVMIASGSYSNHSLAIQVSGNNVSLWSWGSPDDGRLGRNYNSSAASYYPGVVPGVGGAGSTNPPVTVAAGANQSLVALADGSVLGWGANGMGQLGNPGVNASSGTPVPVPVVGVGGTGTLGGATMVSANQHSVAVLADGRLLGWGPNWYGELGDNASTQRNTPVTVAGDLLFTNRTARPTFSAEGGCYLRAPAITVGSLTTTATIRYTLDGSDPGPTSPSVPAGGALPALPGGTTILRTRAFAPGLAPSAVKSAAYQTGSQLAAGYSHSMLLDTDGGVWAWGDNSTGQLGAADPGDIGSQLRVLGLPTRVLGLERGVKAIAAGAFHNLILKEDGTVWGWGSNSDGQLGVNPAVVAQSRSPVPVPIPGTTGNPVVAIGAAAYHSFAIQADGTLLAWGNNNDGKLGRGTFSGPELPARVDTSSGFGSSPVIAALGGTYHSLALRADGTVWSWGDNTYGELGVGYSYASALPAQVGVFDAVAIAGSPRSSHAMALDGGGRAWSWGANGYGQLGRDTTSSGTVPTGTPGQVAGANGDGLLTGVIALAGGESHSLAALRDGRTCAWGWNYYGQLGSGSGGSNTQSAVPLGVSGIPSGGAVVCAGSNHTLAGINYRGVYIFWSWGNNYSGQLGASSGTTPFSVSPLLVTVGTDADHDGLSDYREYQLGTDPLNPDSNGDGLPDGAAAQMGLDPNDPDTDHDGLTNAQERMLGTDPLNADTDHDGVPDGQDAFPLDPGRSAPLPTNPNDHTPPTINLTEPANAVPL